MKIAHFSSSKLCLVWQSYDSFFIFCEQTCNRSKRWVVQIRM